MNVFIYRHNNQYLWYVVSDQSVQSEKYHGNIDDLAMFYQQHSQIRNWVLVIAAADVALKQIPFSNKERKHIRKAVPFLLEDELLSEADELHVVQGKLREDRVEVAAIDQQLLQNYLAELEEQGIRPSHCIAQSKLLPDSDSEWLIAWQHGEYVVKTAKGEPLAFDIRHIALGLELLTEQYAHLPKSIELVAESEEELAQAREQLPEAMQHLLQPRVQDCGIAWQQQFSRKAALWNFLQGRFAYAQQWLVMIKPWRWAAAALLLAFVLHSSLLVVETRHLRSEHNRLQQQITGEFRKVVPQGQMVDPRRQLNRILSSLQQGGEGTAFVGMMQDIGTVLSKHQVQTINSVNFEYDRREVRLDMLVENYDQLQTMIDEIKEMAMEVEIQNSNAQGDALRARIRVSG